MSRSAAFTLFLSVLIHFESAHAAANNSCRELFKSSPVVDFSTVDTLTAYSKPSSSGPQWTSDRKKLHASILQRFKSAIVVGSAILNRPEPTLILSRGNSGSGKSYAIKNSREPLLASLHLSELAQKSEDGIVNPDSIKAYLQQKVHDNQISSQAVHEEGSYLAKKLTAYAFAHRLSFVIDKRFTTFQSVDAIVSTAKQNGYKVVLVDVDAPILDSSLRIVDRPIGGSSPNVPFDAIASGFQEARKFREAVANEARIDDYVLLSGGEVVARRSGAAELKVLNAALWKQLTNATSAEVLRSKHLYADLLNALAASLPSQLLKPFARMPEPRLQVAQAASKEADFLKNYGLLLQMRDFHTLIQKDAGQLYHVKFANAVEAYLKATQPDLVFSSTLTPETSTRMASISLRIETKSAESAQLLLHDSRWPFRLVKNENGVTLLNLETRDLAIVAPDRLVEEDQNLGHYQIGFQTSKINGESAYSFMKAANTLGLHLKEAPLALIRPKAGRIHFGNENNTVKFGRGFHLEEVQARLFAAQVDFFLKDTSGFKTNLRAADEFLTLAEWAVHQKAPLNTFELVIESERTSEELKTWLQSNRETINQLRIEKLN